MVALGQTITVINKSGKVVSTSKNLLGVFKEAKSAYRERKAEIKAEQRAKQAEQEARRALATYTIQDDRSTTSSRRHSGRSKSVVRHGDRSSRHHGERRSSHHYDQDLHSTMSGHREIARRHTSHDIALARAAPPYPTNRSHSAPHVDMDLAYGEFHPSSIERIKPPPQEEDLHGLVGKVKGLLVEADCAQHGVTATIAHLQKNPDAMAAVALTLAEISNVLKTMAPTALTALKSASPAVFALLSSPQFMIAAGVGIGVTVVMFGGYKIVKKIQAANEAKRAGEQEQSMDEMMEIDPGLSRIETWRRGVAESEVESCGTSVDGEFITPTAAAMSRTMLPGRVNELREPTYVKDDASSYSRHSRTSRSSRHSKSSSKSSRYDSEYSEKKKKKKDKEKKPSKLRLLFK